MTYKCKCGYKHMYRKGTSWLEICTVYEYNRTNKAVTGAVPLRFPIKKLHTGWYLIIDLVMMYPFQYFFSTNLEIRLPDCTINRINQYVIEGNRPVISYSTLPGSVAKLERGNSLQFEDHTQTHYDFWEIRLDKFRHHVYSVHKHRSRYQILV